MYINSRSPTNLQKEPLHHKVNKQARKQASKLFIPRLQVELVDSADAVKLAKHHVTLATDAGEVTVGVARADGCKCARCWNYSMRLGGDASHPELCERCTPIVRALNFSLPAKEPVAA